MQFKFSALLTGVVIALTAEALPLPYPKPTTGTVTLPLKRLEYRSDAHPQIVHQQHINRGYRRLARMTGRAEPTTEELTNNLRKRILSIEGEEGLSKRYNRVGLPKASAKAKSSAKSANSGAALAIAKAHGNKQNGNQIDGTTVTNANGGGQTKHKGGAKGGAAAAGAGAGGIAGAGAAGAAGNGTAGAAGNGTATASTDGGNGTANAAPDTVTPAGKPTGQDSLGLDIEANDVGYLATVQMGTPPRDFSILMDSGSADLWVGAENCKSQVGGGCGNHNFLGTQSSSTFTDTKQPFSVTYGTGSVSGNIVTDDIVVAGLALKAHKFGVAATESVEFSDDSTPFDGLMGLAQSTLSEQKTLTPIEALAANGLVKEAITSYKISRLADNKNDGEITFGGVDATKFDAKTLVTLDNVSQQGFWEGDMDAVSVDGTDVGLTGRTAILDTGTTLIIAPAADAAAVHKGIQGAKSDGQGGFTVPCTTTASVALTFGGTSFAIDPRDIAVQPVDPTDPTGDCFSGIAAGNVGGAQEWLVGDVFLKNAYFSTDVTKKTLSLAKLV